ncbi:hypothetical protein DUNSADRAFT_12613 [Dunaliella salina]|uniref:SET domain-containing protein n=1 Tax=Dunaliella salina TaxID=3046 RepID=A0ABQ7GAZ2_DUNSA|nr:hypothetical protein DUNSADRAFT_12613 [Dunaliella salina]|eukprot:KAF5831743.1 hypothetical protein DUNSADRAFT_12613 [Dunaliella salina]
MEYREDPCQEDYQTELIHWIREQGGKVNVRFGRNAEGVRGLQAAKDCEQGGCLIKVPAHLTLPLPYTDSAYSAPWLLRQVIFHGLLPSTCGTLAHSKDNGSCNLNSSSTSGCYHSPLQQGPDISAFPFMQSQPGPANVLSGYNWPEEAIPLLATPKLERLVRIFKRRAARVFATGCRAASEEAAKKGMSGVAAAAATAAEASQKCRGAPFDMTLHQAEVWAQAKHAQQQQMEDGISAHKEGSHYLGLGQHGSQSSLHHDCHSGPQNGCLTAPEHPQQQATLQDVEWAASVICTRSFSTAFDGIMAIVPLVDMTNHTTDHSAIVESSSESDDGDHNDDDDDDEHDSRALDRESRESWQQDLCRCSPPSRQRKGETYIRPVWGRRKKDATLSKQQLQQQQHDRQRKSENRPPDNKGAGKYGRLRVEHSKQKQRQEREERRLQQYQDWLEQQQQQQQHEELQQQQQAADHAHALQPEQLARFRQRPWRVKSAGEMRKGDEVTFTYHNGLRDDELLIYYGFLPAPPSRSSVPQVQELMAVDHPRFRTVSSDSEDGDLYDRQGDLVIDPLHGSWRGSTTPFQGTVPELQAEMQRLASLLADLDARCQALKQQRLAAGDQVHGCRTMPWLPGMLGVFRRRRRAGLEHEIARLQDELLRQQLSERACADATSDLVALQEEMTGMGLS